MQLHPSRLSPDGPLPAVSSEKYERLESETGEGSKIVQERLANLKKKLGETIDEAQKLELIKKASTFPSALSCIVNGSFVTWFFGRISLLENTHFLLLGLFSGIVSGQKSDCMPWHYFLVVINLFDLQIRH